MESGNSINNINELNEKKKEQKEQEQEEQEEEIIPVEPSTDFDAEAHLELESDTDDDNLLEQSNQTSSIITTTTTETYSSFNSNNQLIPQSNELINNSNIIDNNLVIENSQSKLLTEKQDLENVFNSSNEEVENLFSGDEGNNQQQEIEENIDIENDNDNDNKSKKKDKKRRNKRNAEGDEIEERDDYDNGNQEKSLEEESEIHFRKQNTSKSKKQRQEEEAQQNENLKNRAADLIDKILYAVERDREAFSQGQPALNKLMLLQEVNLALIQSKMQQLLLEKNILAALQHWLTILSDGTLPNPRIRSTLLMAFKSLKVDREDLENCSILRVITALSRACDRKEKLEWENLMEKWQKVLYYEENDYDSFQSHYLQKRQFDTPTKKKTTSFEVAPIAVADLQTQLTQTPAKVIRKYNPNLISRVSDLELVYHPVSQSLNIDDSFRKRSTPKPKGKLQQILKSGFGKN
eukprot:TRINITY_DN849_c1_g1_i1.p1 TRINITY_DN849_c1_g1~~TRINITY_DN849_c1_g1_i1.p1  ORF type:complete len:465 (+),score=221.61 TRINITY_DN849_c1_g1_i1:46-1440(+)